MVNSLQCSQHDLTYSHTPINLILTPRPQPLLFNPPTPTPCLPTLSSSLILSNLHSSSTIFTHPSQSSSNLTHPHQSSLILTNPYSKNLLFPREEKFIGKSKHFEIGLDRISFISRPRRSQGMLYKFQASPVSSLLIPLNITVSQVCGI